MKRLKVSESLISQLILSLKLGDGCLVDQSKTKHYYLQTNSINLDYITHKKVRLEKLGVKTNRLRIGKSGYKESSKIYTFTTPINPLISNVGSMIVSECIRNLNKIGLIYFFLDDGSLHKRKAFGHIYCNTFSDSEVEVLIERIFQLYPYKRCSKRIDKKKDGRKYPYIYIPVSTMNEFRKDIEKFLNYYDIQSLMYKAVLPSQTVENKV